MIKHYVLQNVLGVLDVVQNVLAIPTFFQVHIQVHLFHNKWAMSITGDGVWKLEYNGQPSHFKSMGALY